MKVMVAFVRKLRRQKFRKRRASQTPSSKDSILMAAQGPSQIPEFRRRGSLEKVGLGDVGIEGSHDTSPLSLASPPAYDECIKSQPPQIDQIGTHDFIEKKADSETRQVESQELERGRTPRILYRSQLTSLAKRKSYKRPSPIRKQIKITPEFGAVDGVVAMRVQYSVLTWWTHLASIGVAGALFISIACFFLLFGI